MKKHLKSASILLAGVAGVAGQAQAQVSFSVTESHGANPPGNPQLVTRGAGSGTGIFEEFNAGGPIFGELWDVSFAPAGFYNASRLNLIDEPTDPSNYVFSFPQAFTQEGLFPSLEAQEAFGPTTNSVSFSQDRDFGLYWLNQGLDYTFDDFFTGSDTCQAATSINRTTTSALTGDVVGTLEIPALTVLGTQDVVVGGVCDSLEISLGLDGVAIDLAFEENSITPLITIPAIDLIYQEIGVFTEESQGAFFDTTTNQTVPTTNVDTFTNRTRDDVLANFYDYMVESGKDQELAAALLDTSVENLPELGSLPQGGDLLALDVAFTRSAASSTGSFSISNVTSDGNGNFNLSFGASSFGEIAAYFLLNNGASDSDFGIDQIGEVRDTDGGIVTLTVLGVSATLAKPENSTTLSLTSTDLDVAESFTGETVDASFALLEDWFDANEDDLGATFLREAQEDDIANDPSNVVAGNPQSVQGVFNANLLALDTPSSILFETSGSTTPMPGEADDGSQENGASGGTRRRNQGGAWLVGGRIGQVEAGTEDGTFIDVIAERGFRISEGSRNRVKLSMPFSYVDFGAVTQSTASIRLGYEHQIVDGTWVLEPSIGAGLAYAEGEIAAGSFEAGSLWSAGLSSRYKIGGIGKGHIVIGNAIGYSQTFDIEVEGAFKSPEISNITYRNGVAYQLPIGQRIFDRLGTLRTSYTHTKVAGSSVAVDEYHDVSINYGVGSRESTVRNFAETLRFGFSGTFGDDYEAYSLIAGFKF